MLPDGSAARFGPYPVTISTAAWGRLGAAAYPNPARGRQQIELFVAGRAGDPAVAARVDVFDLGGRRVLVWRARHADAESRPGAPGTVRRDASGVRVLCGDGRALALVEVEIGGRRGDAAAFPEVLADGARFDPAPPEA